MRKKFFLNQLQKISSQKEDIPKRRKKNCLTNLNYKQLIANQNSLFILSSKDYFRQFLEDQFKKQQKSLSKQLKTPSKTKTDQNNYQSVQENLFGGKTPMNLIRRKKERRLTNRIYPEINIQQQKINEQQTVIVPSPSNKIKSIAERKTFKREQEMIFYVKKIQENEAIQQEYIQSEEKKIGEDSPIYRNYIRKNRKKNAIKMKGQNSPLRNQQSQKKISSSPIEREKIKIKSNFKQPQKLLLSKKETRNLVQKTIISKNYEQIKTEIEIFTFALHNLSYYKKTIYKQLKDLIIAEEDISDLINQVQI